MVNRDHMESIVQAYVDGFAKGDGSALARLFADDATVEDPVGSPPIIGHVAITEFYTKATASGARLTLHGPVRVAGDTVAFAFGVHFFHQGNPMRVDVIDTFRFNTDGKISAMRAHWDEANMHVEPAGTPTT